MDMQLNRYLKDKEGIFSQLCDEHGNEIAVTLEHAYEKEDGSYEPKIPPGVYTCIRGEHELHNLSTFETFEVTGVEGHSGLLFHIGNFNEDSEGCILVGEEKSMIGGHQCVVNSTASFYRLLILQEGLDKFTLTVRDLS